jgi:hypothetical protein
MSVSRTKIIRHQTIKMAAMQSRGNECDYWQNDKPQFDGATIAQLRPQLREWAASQDLLRRRKLPGSFMFMVVDKDILDKATRKSYE